MISSKKKFIIFFNKFIKITRLNVNIDYIYTYIILRNQNSIDNTIKNKVNIIIKR